MTVCVNQKQTPAAQQPAIDSSAAVASKQHAGVYSLQTNPCKANIPAQLLQKESIPSQPTGPMLFLDTSEILKKNVLVDIRHDELAACKIMIDACCKEDRKAARKRYSNLRTKCVKKDTGIDRSYRLLPGTANEWQQFCQDCTCLIVLQHSLFLQAVQIVPLELPDEKAVQNKAVELCLQGRSASRVRMTDFDNLKPELSYYVYAPLCVLKCNNVLIFTGKDATSTYTGLNAKYDSHAAAQAAYQQHLTVCKKLDSEVMHLDATFPDAAPTWQKFRESYLQLAALRRFLFVNHRYDPFTTITEETRDLPVSHASKIHKERLQLTSPTHPSKMMPATSVETAAAPEGDDRDVAMIYTKVPNTGCLCIEHGKIVWRQGPFKHNVYKARVKVHIHVEEPVFVECTSIHPDDAFELHVSGILPDKPFRVQAGGSLLMMSMLQCQNLSEKSQATALSELYMFQDRLQDLLSTTDPEQLSNLAMIGVPGAVKVYETVCYICVKCLVLQYFTEQAPIVIGSDIDSQPLVPPQVIDRSLSSMASPFKFYQQKASNVRGDNGMADTARQTAAVQYLTAARFHNLEKPKLNLASGSARNVTMNK